MKMKLYAFEEIWKQQFSDLFRTAVVNLMDRLSEAGLNGRLAPGCRRKPERILSYPENINSLREILKHREGRNEQKRVYRTPGNQFLLR